MAKIFNFISAVVIDVSVPCERSQHLEGLEGRQGIGLELKIANAVLTLKQLCSYAKQKYFGMLIKSF